MSKRRNSPDGSFKQKPLSIVKTLMGIFLLITRKLRKQGKLANNMMKAHTIKLLKDNIEEHAHTTYENMCATYSGQTGTEWSEEEFEALLYQRGDRAVRYGEWCPEAKSLANKFHIRLPKPKGA